MKRLLVLLTLLVVLLGVQPAASQGNDPLMEPVKVLVPEVISVREHDLKAYTQGFLLPEGALYESTGLRGESALRQVDPETGEVLKSVTVPEEYFAEGLERVGDKLIQLTWQENVAFVYDINTFEQIGTFDYTGEGWGLCADGKWLYMSDGSPFLSLRDAETFELVHQGMVTYQGQPVYNLNELECVGDYVYANIWKTNFIVQINKVNGVVVAVIDASELLTAEETAELGEQDVLNGIAYQPDTDTFLITGKRWPKMFEVRFVEAPTQP